MKKGLLFLLIFSSTFLIGGKAFAQWQYTGNPGFSTGPAYYTSIAVANNKAHGTPYIVFEDEAFGSKATVMKYNGTGWIVVGSAGFTNGVTTNESIAIASDGTPYVAYVGPDNLAAVMKYNGSSWVTVGSGGFSAGKAFYTSIALDNNDVPYVAYYDYYNGGTATVQKFDGANWDIVGTAGFSVTPITYISIALDNNNTPYVVYSDGGQNGNATVQKFYGGSWALVGTAGFSAGSALYTCIAIDNNNTPYVAYQDQGNSGKATVMNFNGSSWVNAGTAGFSVGQASYESLAITSYGTPYITYIDGANSSKATVMKFNGSSWLALGNAGFSAGAVGYTSMIIDKGGRIYVGYEDEVHELKTSVMQYQVCTVPVITAQPTSIKKCAGGNASFIVSATGTALTYQWQANTGGGFANISNNATYSGATNDTLVVTDVTVGMNGNTYRCIVSACDSSVNSNSVTLTVDTLPVVTAHATSVALCKGLQTTLTGGGANSYVWNNGASNGVAFAPAASSNYNVTGTDGNGCTDTTSIFITVYSLPIVKANASADSICKGSTVTLTGSGAQSYTWNNGVTNGVAFAPQATNTYTVTGTDVNTCTASASITITVNNLPGVKANTSATAICTGSNVTLTGGGALSYTWNNGVTNAVAFAPPSTNTYTVTGTDVNGCSGTASVTVTVNALPTVTANASANPVCAGSNEVLTGGGAKTYSWNNSVTNGVAFTPVATNTYTVTGTDVNGCSGTASITVTVNNAPMVTANTSAASVCAGGSVTLTGGGALTYAWNNGVTNAVAFIPASTKTYTVTGNDINGCSGTASVTVTVNALPTVTANATPSTSICTGSNVTLTGGGAKTYSWNNSVTNAVSFVPASTKSYSVTGTDVNGCSGTASVTVTVNALPTVTANASANPVCAGSNETLTGGGAKTYSWNNSVTNGVAFTPVATNTYTVTGTDVNGCSGTASITVTVNNAPIVTASTSASSVCAGGNVTLTGSDALTYVWNNGVTNAVAFVPASTKTYTVTGTDVNGCSGTASVMVTVNVLPTVIANATPSTSICTGSNVTLTGSGAKTYSWNNSVTNAVSFVPASTKSYSVTGTDVNGCSGTASVTVTVNALPTVTANASANPVCAGSNETLTGSGALTYVWNNSVTNAVAFAATNSNTYTVTGTDVNGCSGTASIAVTVNPIPTLTANASATNICPGTSVTLTATGAQSYNWNYNITNGLAFAPGTTNTYTVTGRGANGCTASANITVTVNPIPLAPASPTGSNATDSSINANWSVSMGATEYFLDVSNSSAFSSFVAGYNNLNVGTVTSVFVRGLIASTTYYFRVRAGNSCGIGANSVTVAYSTASAGCGGISGGIVSPTSSVICASTTQMLTLTGASPGVLQWQSSPDTITWSNINGATTNSYQTSVTSSKGYYRCLTTPVFCPVISSTTAIINISVKPVVTVTAVTATAATVTWAPYASGQYNISWSGAGAGFAPAVTTNNYTITGLSSNQKLQVKISPIDSACNGTSSGTATTTTLCGVPVIISLTAAPAPAYAFNVKWTAVNGATAYRIYYRDMSSAGTWLTVDTTGTAKTILGTSGAQTFAVYIAAKNCPSAGLFGEGSTWEYITTNPPSSCAVIPIISAVSSCPNQITVNLSGGSGSYSIKVLRVSPSVTSALTYPTSSAVTNITVGAQATGSVWEIYASSVCSGVSSPPSNPVFVTIQPACPAIKNIVISNISCTGFAVSWNTSTCGTIGISNYELMIKASTALNYTSYTIAKTNNYDIVNWLTGNTTYDVVVTSVSCNNSVSPSSSPVTATVKGCRTEEQVENTNSDNSENKNESVIIYPNPAQHQFSIDIGRRDMTSAIVKIELVNQLGQVIQTDINEISYGHLNALIMAPAGITSGIYFIRTSVGSNTYVSKLMVAN